MTAPIGYYVHHHGAGHLARAMAIAAPETKRFVLMGTGLAGRTGAVGALDLPDDRPVGRTGFDGLDAAPDRPQSLHYAPLHHAGVRRRTALLADWIDACRPPLMVVDVSVEIAMLSRLSATPTLVVRLAGDRTDPAHLDAFRGATAILAPFHPDLEDAATPEWVRAKTRYAPGLSPAVACSQPVDERVVVVVFGSGGGEADGEALAQAARATPDLTWRVLGPMSSVQASPSNLIALGWVDNVNAEVAGAGVVIGSAGNGVVGAVLRADRPFLCMPQGRPYDEQRSTARGLAAQGAAIMLERWPAADRWPDLFQAARQQDGASRRRLVEGDDAAAIHRWVVGLADAVSKDTGVPR